MSTAAANAIKTAIRANQDKLGIKQRLENMRNKRRQLAEEDDHGLKPSPSQTSIDSGAGDDKMPPEEAIGHVLLKLASLMVREQNFMMEFFKIVKKFGDTEEVAESIDPEEMGSIDSLKKWQENLLTAHHIFKDPKAEKRIGELMDILFDVDRLRESLLNLIDLGLKLDQSAAVGMMVHIEFYLREYQNTCHVFIVNLYEQLHKRAHATYEKFVSEQIKLIEETKVTSKKRNGVLPFMKTFPKYVDRMERMLSNWDGLARKTVNKSYAKIIKSMFETLEACAQQAGNDIDEKDSLNLHIMTVENMHHFYTKTRARKVPGLEESVKQAKLLYDFNLESYCNVVIRKPLGKLVDFFEGVEGLLKTGPAHEVSFHVQYSKNALKDVIKRYPGREVHDFHLDQKKFRIAV